MTRVSRTLVTALAAVAVAGLAWAAARERPPLPAITQPVTFGTPEADRIDRKSVV